MFAELLQPILAVEECSGIAVTIPVGATVEYECDSVVLGVADLQWHGRTYFANVEDVVEASWLDGSHCSYSSSTWVN